MLIIAEAISPTADALKTFPQQFLFVPFMLGTISLILFLSGRNAMLANRIRELCKDIQTESAESMKGHLIEQLVYFGGRYRISNTALMLAVFSVFSFGMMIASSLFHHWGWSRDILHDIPVGLCVLGGATATIATLLSIYETYIARRSLFTHIVFSVVEAAPKRTSPCLTTYLIRIERLSRGHVEEALAGRLSELIHSTAIGSESPSAELATKGEQNVAANS